MSAASSYSTKGKVMQLLKPIRFLLLVLVFLLIHLITVPGCSGSRQSATGVKALGTGDGWVESTLKKMTLEEKVAQLVFVWTESGYMSEDSPGWQEVRRLTVDRKLGGFIFSIGDVYEYAVQINKLQALSEVPLMIAADFEFGAGMRIRRSTLFPRAMAVGATRNPDFSYRMGKAIAREARAVGVHQNYAPVVDVNNNPMNPVINTRAFGDDVRLVTDMALAFIKGSQEEGEIATVKHFPGHGDTDIDTHLRLPVLTLPKSRFESIELPPFKDTFDAGVMSVMVAHISATAYDSVAGIPATVSPIISTDLLKKEMGFQGLVVTDAMVMKGVADKYQTGEAAVLSIKAGTDLVLMPPDVDIALDAIVAAVRRGEIPEGRIDESVRKFLRAKQWLGLDQNRLVDVDKIFEVVNSLEHRSLAKEIARKSVTVLGDAKGLLPLTRSNGKKVVDLLIADEEDPSNGRQFHGDLQRRMGRVDFALIDPRSDSLEYASAMQKAMQADLVIAQLHFYTRSGQMTGFLPEKVCSLLCTIVRSGKPVVGISFGNPYIVMDFPGIDTYVCSYSGIPVVIDATAEVLFGEQPATGKLSIEIPGVYKYGDGVEYPKTALSVGDAREAGFDPVELSKVDNVIKSAIKDSAFPGAQLLVAKDGIIVHKKSYGFFDYGIYSPPVENSTLYDLASVTKVVATTNAVMRLADENRLNLDDPVVKYIPEFAQNGKEKITLYNLMVHNSGLPAWRKFYEFCRDPRCVLDSVYATGLIYKTGDSTIYSDLGLITMGKVLERVSGTTLDRYVDSVFFQPLGMIHTRYNPPESLRTRIAPTEVDSFWQRTFVPVQGRVHDENAATLGGVSGHAGLFSTSSDLAIMMQMLLNGGVYGGKRYLKEETIQRFTTRQSGQSSRGIGWDTRSEGRSFSGSLTSPLTFLHTGFTGTSVVCDPEKKLIVILLTNRVYPTRNTSKIFRVRPEVHDAVLRAVKTKSASH